AGMPILQLNEGQRRWPRGEMRVARTSSAFRQNTHQLLPKQVGGQAGEKLHRRPEPAERNGRVEYCAAGIGRECRFVGRGTARQHVDEGFAAAKDHESKLQSGYSTAAAGLANSARGAKGWCGQHQM